MLLNRLHKITNHVEAELATDTHCRDIQFFYVSDDDWYGQDGARVEAPTELLTLNNALSNNVQVRLPSQRIVYFPILAHELIVKVEFQASPRSKRQKEFSKNCSTHFRRRRILLTPTIRN